MVGPRQDSHGTMSATLGATLRAPWLFPLASGIHRIAFRCLGEWSEPATFYWESERLPSDR